MSVRHLDHLFQPRSVAVIGASDREHSLGATLMHNLLAGGTWVPDEADGLSVEDGLATTLGLKLGDTLTFDIAGIQKSGRVTSLRKVDWGSMRVNFFVMFPQSRMDDVPLSYICLLYTSPSPRD